MSSPRSAARRWWRRSGRYRPHTVTGAIVYVTVVAYVVQLLTFGDLQDLFQYSPLYSLPATGAPFEPWRMLTALVIHAPVTGASSVLALTHIGFNMYALYLFGRPLEDLLGGGRMLALYLLGGFGGSVAVLYAPFLHVLDPRTAEYGASGAVFAVLAAADVVQRRLGVDARYLYVLIAINFALGFVLGGISWQAHLGGLIVGAVAGWAFVRNRGPRRTRRAVLEGAAIAAVLVVLTAVPVVLGAVPPIA